jgi:predicted ATP-grasp superfamily ATP-dependent carboligase
MGKNKIEKSKYPPVLVTDADSSKSLAVVRALGPFMQVYTTASTKLPLAKWSKYVTKNFTHKLSKSSQFPQWLLDVCLKNNIKVIIVPEEKSCFLLSRQNHLFEYQGIKLTTPPFDALKIAMDKSLTIEAATQVNVPVPPTRTPENNEQAIANANQLGYPVVVKPRFSHYWHDNRFISTSGVMYADSDQQLSNALQAQPKELPPPLLQKFIPGQGLGIFLLIGKNGSLLSEFAHQRLRDLRPTGSGSVLRKSVPVDPQLKNWSVELLTKIGFQGVAMAEFRADSTSGKKYLMEINGRFWGSLQLATDSGVNFPKTLVDDALGLNVQKCTYKNDVIVRWWLGDLVRTIRVLKGKPAGFKGEFPTKISAIKDFLGCQPKGTRNEIIRLEDPRPAVGQFISILESIIRRK